MHTNRRGLLTHRVVAHDQLAAGLAREPFEKLLQWAVFDFEVRRHRFRPGPVAPRGGDGSSRHRTVAVDEHFRAGADGGIALARVPMHAALTHAQAREAIDDGHGELCTDVAELAG